MTDWIDPTWPASGHGDGRQNALITVNDRGTVLDFGHAHVTAMNGHYAAIDVRADDCEIHNANFGMRMNQPKGITVHGDRTDGGTFLGTGLFFGPSPHADTNGFLCDPADVGLLSKLILRDVVSVNSPIKVAAVRTVKLYDIRTESPERYALITAENVRDLFVDGFDLNGFVTHFPDPNYYRSPESEYLASVVLKNGRLTGTHDHLKAYEAVWEDMEISFTYQLPGEVVYKIGVVDETPSDLVRGRVFKNVRFTGQGTPYVAKEGCGGKVKTIGCTWNGEPWNYTD